MSYTPRTTQPSNDDLRWRSQSAGGYNNFPNVAVRWGTLNPYSGSVLANCTGYAQGRWMEIGKTNTPYAFSGNAGNWLNEAKAAGYETGTEPALGAIAVFSGHVCVVEDIPDDGIIITSESAYASYIFNYPVERTKENGWQRSGGHAGTFLGFIYHPNVEPIEPEYSINIYKGTASKYSAKAGEIVTITATVERGQHFQRWETKGITLDHPASRVTTFLMPANNVYITAIIKDYRSGAFLKANQVIKGGATI